MGNHQAAVHEGGIEAVVHAMALRFENAYMQLHGCGALHNLCSTDTCREAVRQLGGVQSRRIMHQYMMMMRLKSR